MTDYSEPREFNTLISVFLYDLSKKEFSYGDVFSPLADDKSEYFQQDLKDAVDLLNKSLPKPFKIDDPQAFLKRVEDNWSNHSTQSQAPLAKALLAHCNAKRDALPQEEQSKAGNLIDKKIFENYKESDLFKAKKKTKPQIKSFEVEKPKSKDTTNKLGTKKNSYNHKFKKYMSSFSQKVLKSFKNFKQRAKRAIKKVNFRSKGPRNQ
ncbi:MAG: hypothetical protein ACON5A_03610 [Candidatus Comchoanobacterales bacterium]